VRLHTTIKSDIEEDMTMKTKTQFKQEMRKYFREAVDKAVGETFTSWFDNLWASLEADGRTLKISGTNYVKDGSDSQPPAAKAADTTDTAQKLKETVKAAIIKGQGEAETIDLRDFKEAAKKAVAEESEADENWDWTVKAINKFRVKIGWGYTDNMGEKTPFSIRVEDGWVENPVVIGELPNGQKIVAFVGEAPWDDYKTYEEAVVGVIHSMARTARNIY